MHLICKARCRGRWTTVMISLCRCVRRRTWATETVYSRTWDYIQQSRTSTMLHDPENTTLVTPCSIEPALLARLLEEMNVALLNILYLSLNIWTCKTSGKTFLGIAIIWVTRTFTLCTALLAVSNALFKRSFSYNSFYCVSFTTAGNLGGTEPSVCSLEQTSFCRPNFL